MFFNQKKGIVFTIISLLLSSFLIILFFYMIEQPIDIETETIRTKISRTNKLISQTEDYVKMHASISAREAINNLTHRMYLDTDTGKFRADFDQDFKTCLTTGSLEGVGCGNFSNLTKVAKDLELFLKHNLSYDDVVVTINNIDLYQKSHWELILRFDLNIKINESYAYWNVNLNVERPFSILGLKDPTHAVVHHSLKDYRLAFEDVPVISFNKRVNSLNSSAWFEKPSTLNSIIKNEQYFEHNLSPSFHDRLRGKMAPNIDLGVVSIVSAKQINTPFLIGASHMDWQFWHNRSVAGWYGFFDFYQDLDLQTRLEILGGADEDFLSGTFIPLLIANKTLMNNVSGTYYYIFYVDFTSEDFRPIVTNSHLIPYLYLGQNDYFFKFEADNCYYGCIYEILSVEEEDDRAGWRLRLNEVHPFNPQLPYGLIFERSGILKHTKHASPIHINRCEETRPKNYRITLNVSNVYLSTEEIAYLQLNC